MRRFFTPLVAFIMSAIFLIGLTACNILGEDLPKNIVIDDSFSVEQEETILAAIEEWNQVGREYLGYDIIIHDGRYADLNGFDVLEDLDDGRNVVYNIKEPDEYYKWLNVSWPQDKSQNLMFGYSFRGDILIFNFNILKEIKEHFGDSGNEYAEYLRLHQVMVLHELGHWLGLKHIRDVDDYYPIMYPLQDMDLQPVLTEKDIQAFCLVHDCLKQP